MADLHLEFPGDSQVGALMRAHSWSGSVLGDPGSWPLSLRTVVRLILNSKFPMFVAWGPELGFLYNDAYAEILGSKHPNALGARFQDIWQEIWSDIEPIIEAALQGQSSYFEDLPLVVERGGYAENAWFTFSYSPLHNDESAIAGMYCSVVETTRQVRDRNLRQFQLNLADRLHPLTSPEEIVESAVEMLADHLNASACWYAEIDDQAGIFYTQSGWFSPEAPQLPPSGKIDDFSPALLTTLKAGHDFICDNIISDARTRDFAHRFLPLGIGAILIVPVIKNGNIVFNINVTKPIAYVWADEDIQAARDLVDRTWVAMENATTQQRLKLERGQSDHILNQMNEGFMVVGPDYSVIRINAEGARILRCSTTEILGHTSADLWPAEIKPAVITAYDSVAKTGTASILELKFTAEAGENWLELRISSLNEKGLAVFFRDVSAQKQAALALRRSEEHLASLFEQTAAGIAERDLHGRLIRVNERLCKILGRTREQVLGVNIHDLTHPDDLTRSEAAFKKLLDDGKPFDIEKRYLRPDGSSVWVSTTVSLVRKIEGQQTDSVLAVILDITERKYAEALAQHAAEERQVLLSNERAARAEAEHLNRSKDEFLAMLAHELRNPLAPVSAAADLLRIASNDPVRVRQVSEILSRQIGHFTHLIRDLMDVSRVTRGLIQLETETLDLKTIIAMAVEQVRPMIEARQHSLVTHFDGEHTLMAGDRTRMVQVVANLLTNSAKYTPPQGQITIKVITDGNMAKIEVADNGNGIEASLLPHVFDLFTQGTRGLDRTQGGLGIGLALVKAIVTLHGGEVEAFSEGTGKGSQFSVTLPRPGFESTGKQPSLNTANTGSALSILIVDDNDDAANALAMLLNALGHKVLVASNALDALEISELERIDVFLLDIGLPDMSGYELAKALRRRPTLDQKLYIALTGYSQSRDRQLSDEAGFAHHLVKPVDNQVLFGVLDGVRS